jgi:hypothetical protein
MMSKIQSNVIKLVSDPFGNYAISEILTNWPHEVCVPIYEKLMSKISELSIQKYSSNVIETCFEFAIPEIKSIFIHELSFSDRLNALIKN